MYRKTNTIVSSVKYQFIICPRYRRKIFLITGVEDAFKTIVCLQCKDMDIEIIDLKCSEDFVYLSLECPATLSPAKIIKEIKIVTSRKLIQEFSELSKIPNLWTKNFLVSTNNLTKKIISDFVNSQRKRY